jgi:hypothetical protein
VFYYGATNAMFKEDGEPYPLSSFRLASPPLEIRDENDVLVHVRHLEERLIGSIVTFSGHLRL